MRPGLCSVTLRRLGVGQVVEVAAGAGLAAIEWGADVHVPPGDDAAADAARDAGERAGIAVASYGSYFRAGDDPVSTLGPVLAAARRLGAPRVRVWAGSTPSAQAGPRRRAEVVAGLRAAVQLAAPIEVALEYHGGTLTDDARSALDLLEAVPSLRTYWQPPQGLPDEDALSGLRLLLPRVAALHVFSWWPRDERLALAERAGLWRQALALAGDMDALLEFVPGDDPALVAREAETLRGLA
jgi:sugar phosphate isomerase/epimerase